jgi:hypothetical protein
VLFDRPDQVVAINRNAWSQSIGISGRNHPVRAPQIAISFFSIGSLKNLHGNLLLFSIGSRKVLRCTVLIALERAATWTRTAAIRQRRERSCNLKRCNFCKYRNTRFR